jgi:hypothetical protein
MGFNLKKNELAREIRELRETGEGLPPTVAEIEECVLGDNAHFYAVTMENYRGIPKGSEVRIVDVQGKQLMIQVRGDSGKQWVPAEVLVGRKQDGQVDVPECLTTRMLSDSMAGEVNNIHNHIAARLGVRVAENLVAVTAGWRCWLQWNSADAELQGELTATERNKKLARAEAARRMLRDKGLHHPIVYAKCAPAAAVAPAKEARRDGPKENGASLGAPVTSDAAASEINTKHNHAVGRLGVTYKEDVAERDGGFFCTLTWTYPDGNTTQVEASGSSKKMARANAATQMLAKQGLGAPDKDIADECLRKLTASAREGVAYVHQVLPTMEPSAWTALLPPVLQTVQDTRDRELIDDFILKTAKITDGLLEPEAWEGMLDVAAQTATGDEAVETLVRLCKMKTSPKKFGSQKQCDVFSQYRGWLSMERQAAINEALQQDFVWTRCKVDRSSGIIGVISVQPEGGFTGKDGGNDQDLAVLECVSRERFVGPWWGGRAAASE